MENPKDRHFVFSAHCNGKKTWQITNFGIVRDFFPSNEYLKRHVLKAKDDSDFDLSGIVILSICELSEADYKAFWAKEQTP